MKKNLGIAVMNFLKIAVLIVLFDLLAVRFSFADFTQIISRPGHIGFIGVLALIPAVDALVQSHHSVKTA